MTSNKKPFVLGLTGGIGTGKSTAASWLSSQGLVHVDADAISRMLTKKEPDTANPVLEEIGEAFCEDGDVLRPDGSLDRTAMAQIVFSDLEKKSRLEEILFKHIIDEIQRQIDSAEGVVLLDVPLLYESGLDSLCDRVIVLTAEEDLRIRRVMERDGCAADDVRARIANQMPDSEKRARADFIVDNSGTKDDLIAQLEEVLQDGQIAEHFSG